MPTISVIVPVYRVEPYIHRCVDSILAQTYTDFELILVDDGSPDNCGEICDEYAQKDSRVVVIHQENGGLSAARNAGIDWSFANSDSQWLTFVDSDDWVHEEMLRLLLDANIQHGTHISICSYVETSGKTIDIQMSDSQVWKSKDFYLTKHVNATIACAKLYHKLLFSQLRYPVGKIHEDEFTTYKILFDVDKIAYLSAPLYAYFINPDGITKRTWSPSRLDIFEAFEEQIQYFKDNGDKDLADRVLQTYAINICKQLNILRSIENYDENEFYYRKIKKLKCRTFFRCLSENVMEIWMLEELCPFLYKSYEKFIYPLFHQK